MKTLQAGMITELKMIRVAPFGYFLTDGENEVLLHQTEVDRELEEDESIRVFIYQDKKGRLAATETIPKITAESFGWVEVVGVQQRLGVFVDIGIKKDMLVSLDDLPDSHENWPQMGGYLYCSLKVDPKAGLMAKLAVENDLEDLFQSAVEADFNRDITGTIYRVVSNGALVIIDDGPKGFVHESETNGPLHLGDMVSGRIIEVKEDGTVNVSLLPRTHERMEDDAEFILDFLQNRNGPMPFGDHSHPDDIRKKFGLSKGAFKRALGKLMKQGKVEQKDGWTFLK